MLKIFGKIFHCLKDRNFRQGFVFDDLNTQAHNFSTVMSFKASYYTLIHGLKDSCGVRGEKFRLILLSPLMCGRASQLSIRNTTRPEHEKKISQILFENSNFRKWNAIKTFKNAKISPRTWGEISAFLKENISGEKLERKLARGPKILLEIPKSSRQ